MQGQKDVKAFLENKQWLPTACCESKGLTGMGYEKQNVPHPAQFISEHSGS